MRWLIATLMSVLSVSALGQDPAPEPLPIATHVVALDKHQFTLPAGFTIERVTTPELVARPITADFDEAGRLYVADSSGSNEKVALQLENPTHRIVRLEDTDGDGRYDKSVVFADKMMFPEGTMWYAGSLYVAAPPHIWKLTDTDDDGVADRREIWFDGKTLTGCANDLHGPYLGPDGWIYWCKGAFAEQEYTLPGGKPFKTRAAHIFRARPDGSGIEPVMTGGMDNPVDVAFTPGGERIFTTTFLQRPAGGHRDGLIHAIYGGIYGKDHDPVYDPVHKWTSPDFMPVLTHLGPAAPCGLHRLESGQFGSDYRDNLFCCQFNLRKVSRHVLKPSGATFTTEDHDFVVSASTDFHPTDVIEDADGSLLIVDTGGWYKLCCPSSQLVKEDVLGAIYRVKRVARHLSADPRGRQIAWNEQLPADLAKLLGDERPAVRRQAIERLATKGKAGAEALVPILADRHSEAVPALAALAVAGRIDDPLARRLIHESMRHENETVVQFAIHLASVTRDESASGQLERILITGNSVANARAAAEALGRIGNAESVDRLATKLMNLEMESTARDRKRDRSLDHSMLYALIEIGEREQSGAAKVGSPRIPLTQKFRSLGFFPQSAEHIGKHVVLDQLGEQIDPAEILPAVLQGNPSALWIASRHPEWGDKLAEPLFKEITFLNPSEARRNRTVQLLAKLHTSPPIRKLIAEAAEDFEPSVGRIGLAAMAASGAKELPADWARVLSSRLVPSSQVAQEALAVMRTIPAAKADQPQLSQALLRLADSQAPVNLRLSALAAVPGGLKTVSPDQLALLLTYIYSDRPADERGLAASALSTAVLTSEQLQALAAELPKCAPLELDRLLMPFAQSTDAEVGQKLLAALREPALRGVLPVDAIRQRLTKYPPVVQTEAERLYAELDAELATQRSRLEATLAGLPAGDIRRGQEVFNSTKTSCRACHTIGYVGGKIGPDLTRIGQIRQPRDLVEAILFPSASFVRSYEPLAVRTLEGQVHSGIVKSDTPAEIVLTLAADKEVRIGREEIEAALPGKVSIMPAGLDKQLSLQELADLVEFLKNCR
jgi:putative membrane-bound dehydrogenase-like protein